MSIEIAERARASRGSVFGILESILFGVDHNRAALHDEFGVLEGVDVF